MKDLRYSEWNYAAMPKPSGPICNRSFIIVGERGVPISRGHIRRVGSAARGGVLLCLV